MGAKVWERACGVRGWTMIFRGTQMADTVPGTHILSRGTRYASGAHLTHTPEIATFHPST